MSTDTNNNRVILSICERGICMNMKLLNCLNVYVFNSDTTICNKMKTYIKNNNVDNIAATIAHIILVIVDNYESFDFLKHNCGCCCNNEVIRIEKIINSFGFHINRDYGIHEITIYHRMYDYITVHDDDDIANIMKTMIRTVIDNYEAFKLT